jgi:hypothetical protein
MRKLFGGAAEDLCEPPDSFLMRYVHEGAVAEDIRQGVWAGIRLPVRHLLRRPKVPPPSHKRQRKENRENSCCKNCRQTLPHMLVSLDSQVLRDSQVHRDTWVLSSNAKVARWLSMAKIPRFNRSIAVAFQFGGRLG